MKKLNIPKKRPLSLTFDKLERMAQKLGLKPYELIDRMIETRLSNQTKTV